MEKLLIILLLITLSCNKDSSSTSEESTPAQTSVPDNIGSTDESPPDEPPPETINRTWTEEFMDLVNEHRAGLGLRSMIHNPDLEKFARDHSVNMANGTVAFGHTGFSSRCSEARSALGGGNWCGENVAAGQRTPQGAFTSWMNSTGHRANIESTKATHTGFGYAKNSSGKYYWTQIFIQN